MYSGSRLRVFTFKEKKLATLTKSRIFDTLERLLGPKLWSQLVTRNANAEVIWRIDREWRLIAATLWMEDTNFERLGTNPSSGELARLVIDWRKSKDLTVKPDEVEISVQK